MGNQIICLADEATLLNIVICDELSVMIIFNVEAHKTIFHLIPKSPPQKCCYKLVVTQALYL